MVISETSHFSQLLALALSSKFQERGRAEVTSAYRLTEDLHTHTLVLEGEMRMLSGRFASTSGDCQPFMLAPTLFLVVGVDWIRDYNFKANWAIGLLNCITSHEIKGVCRNCNIYFFFNIFWGKKNNRSVIDRLIFYTFFELLKIHVIRVFFLVRVPQIFRAVGSRNYTFLWPTVGSATHFYPGSMRMRTVK